MISFPNSGSAPYLGCLMVNVARASVCPPGHALFVPFFVLTHRCVSWLYHIPSSEILEFPSVINFDIITSDDINFHFHFLP